MRKACQAPAIPTSLKVLFFLMCISAFLTGTRLIPVIANNVGPFEALVGITAALFMLGLYGRERILLHPLNVVLLLIAATAFLSVVVVEPARLRYALVQLVMLVVLAIFTIVTYNLIRRFRISPDSLLRVIVFALIAIGPWLIADQLIGGSIQSVGPFRNRAHMGSYMLTAFWFSLMLALWPGLPKRSRIAAIISLLLSIYAIAASGRRSVYLSLGFGLSCLFPAIFVTARAQRLPVAALALLLISFIGVLYGGEVTPQTRFFEQRVGMVDDRLQSLAGAAASDEAGSFFSHQLAGVKRAVRESPIIGIGWGGFAKSRFSPTGHEVHSTPLRFLAEMGFVGLLLYAGLISILFVGAARSYIRMRHSQYAASYLAHAIAIASLSISWLYNRHITERSFWLFLGVFLACTMFATARQRELFAKSTET